MMRMMRTALTLLVAVGSAGALAQDYPSRPVRMIVPFVAGGPSDVLARAVAQAMREGLGQTIVVENRGRAGGNVGAEAAARAEPDGYTVLFGTIGTHGIGPALYKDLKYDPVKDLAPVGLLHELPNLLVVSPSVPAMSLAELIQLAKAKPGELSFGSAGNGSVSHLAGELLKHAAQIELIHVPYRGGGAAMPDLLAGRISMMLEPIPNTLPQAKAGNLRALAVTTVKRSSVAPEIPTMAEAGLPGYAVSSWTGLFVPARTPRAIIDRLNAETVRITKDPQYLEFMKSIATEPVSSTPEAFGAFVVKEVATWTDAVQRSGARID